MLRVVGHFENEILHHFNQNGSLLSNHNLGPERLTLSAILNNDGSLFFQRNALDNKQVIGQYDSVTNKFIKMDQHVEIDANQYVLRSKIHKDKGLTVKLVKDFRFYHADIFDDAGNKVHSICSEFMAENAYVAFTKKCLIIHTDYGVLSIYRIS